MTATDLNSIEDISNEINDHHDDTEDGQYVFNHNWNNPALGNIRLKLTELYPKHIVELFKKADGAHSLFRDYMRKDIENSVKSDKELDGNLNKEIPLWKKIFSKLKPWEKNEDYYTLETSYYQKRKEYGRLQCNKGIGYQSMENFIRATFCKDLYYDLDMKNAHPTLILQFLNKNNIENKSLTKYIENRDAVIKDLIDHYGFSNRVVCKKAFITMLNNGKPKKEIYPKNVMNVPFIKEFYTDMKRSIEQVYKLCKNNDEFKMFYVDKEIAQKYYEEDKKHDKNVKPPTTNYMGSTINYVAQWLENRALFHTYQFLNKCGLNVDTLIFDGLHIRRYYDEKKKEFRDLDFTELIPKLEEYVFTRMGYRVGFDIKPFDCGIPLDTLQKAAEFCESFKNMYDLTLASKYHELHKEDICLTSDKRCFLYREDSKLWKPLDGDSLGLVMCEKLTEYFSSYKKDYEIIVRKIIDRLNKIGFYRRLGKAYIDNIKHVKDEDVVNLFNKTNPYLIPYKDKVLDLKTFKSRPREKEDYFTYSVKRDLLLREKEGLKQVELFMKSFFFVGADDENPGYYDLDTFKAFKRIQGYSMTGLTHNKCMFVLLGPSNSGKSTILNLMNICLETEGTQMMSGVNEKLFVGVRTNTQPELVIIEGGLRIGTKTEFEEKQTLNASYIKELTGDDPIAFRTLYVGDRTIDKCITKFFIGTNEMPHFKSHDSGLDTRLMFIPFRNVFDVERDNKKKEDFKLNCMDYFFTWLCKQAYYFVNKGEQIIKSPAMLALKREVNEEKNELSDFFSLFEETENEDEFLAGFQLFNLFKKHETHHNLTQKQFACRCAKLFVNKVKKNKRVNGKMVNSFYKYRLIPNDSDVNNMYNKTNIYPLL